MSDLISKSKLQDMIMDTQFMYDCDNDEHKEHDITGLIQVLMKSIVDEIPTVQVPEWIPCSERMPEEQYDVDFDMNISYPVLATFGGTLERDPEPFWTVVVVFTIDGEWFHNFERPVFTTKTIGVTAWMPIPEPYKEGE